MSKKSIFFVSLLIIIFAVLFCMALASAAGVSQDGAGDWRINTYPEGERGKQHLVFGLVFVPGKGVIYENSYGSTDTVDCSNNIVMLRSQALARVYQNLARILNLLNYKNYVISTTAAICHNEWYVIYISRDKINAPKEVYDEVFKALQ